MATFLATRKMTPELRARVEASVSGNRGSSGSRLSPRAVMSLRAVAVTTAAACLIAMGLSKRRSDDAFAAERAALIARWKRETSGLSVRDRAIVARVDPWIQRSSREYEGDDVEPSLRRDGVLNELLRRPAVYLRAPVERILTEGVEPAALDSTVDAFVLCLMDPPKDRSEKWLVRRVRSAYSSDARMREATGHFARLGAAFVGLPFLDEAWLRRIQKAEGAPELAALRRNFERAPIQAARDAAKASLLLLVLDEPGSHAVPAELDGERPHDVRVVLVDLAVPKLLLRVRKPVDPRWLSDGGRAEFATGADSCALAVDVRSELSSSPPAASHSGSNR